MPTYTLKKDGKWYDKETGELAPKEWRNRKIEVFSSRVLPVLNDEMAATRHPVNGQIYTSKAKFRAETKAHECVEVGSEKLSKQRREEVKMENPRELISHVYDALRDGRKIEVDDSVKGFG